MNWISVKNELPYITEDFNISDNLLFVMDNIVYSGFYENNKCFYATDGYGSSGYTQEAVKQWGMSRLKDMKEVTHWMWFPAPPDKYDPMLDDWCAPVDAQMGG